ncbi:MAG TPA: ribose 1,5-bisphosphate isomerase, partial [Acidobacteriota bacterium]|nr:ribose 1,5-bisphosphate isomerase [Acidobacteriota bacterium]
MEHVRNTANKIRRLDVKGARNVAIAALEALRVLALETDAKTREEFHRELSKAKGLLFSSRPTEPLMRNAVNWVTCNVKSSEKKRVGDLARVVSSSACEFLRSLEESRERIAEIGAKRIRDGMIVFTHC